jgi:hypothetical protein
MSTQGFLTTEGLQWLLETAFSEEQSVPANFHLGLSQNNLVKGSVLSGNGTGWNEVTGTGYARQTIASNNTDFTSAASTTDRKVTALKQTFEASGADWDAATDWFLATTSDNTGKIVACGRLAASRQLAASGDKLEVTPEIVLTSTDPNA